ncbi:deoxyribose-phosphate aldolase isoform X1 [Xiphias gladius]|uniref:deoxyribose-phosphate aldolase isoform X1 n=1 Tax=Xiphias gladius TaxID=8245 RepID=UPI001A99D661|nr:deoxyribose-phosphate aldolase isoform X1 [Xiphias gladius]
MTARNPGTNLDLEWISKARVNTQAVLKRAQCIQGQKTLKKQWQAAWLLKAVTCIDLTTLAGDDTPSNVHRLCLKAIQPIRYDLLKKMDMHNKGLMVRDLVVSIPDSDAGGEDALKGASVERGVTTAAVCVYPSRVADAVTSLKAANSSLPVASVATGFPAGQTPLETRLQEVRMAVADGATEIDIVINRTLALTGQWEAMYDEIRQFREACGDAHMKTILAIGELGTFTNVYKASMVAMMAGSDFIKTSTGKEAVNATYPVAIVMVRAIRDYFLCTGHKVGFKPAGGIRTAQESLVWLTLIKEELGNDWLCPQLFRLGASSLLADIERQIYHHVTGQYAAYHELPMA